MAGCLPAVRRWRTIGAKAGIDASLSEIDWTGVFWQNSAGGERRPRLDVAEAVGGTPPSAPPVAKSLAPNGSAGANGKARRKPSLSVVVVVVVYNIPREAPCTLLTLSASYQRHIGADDYEVIVVDNGSKPPLDPAVIEGLSGNFRLIRIDPAPPSPAHAINRGIAAAQGEVIGT